MELSGSSAGNYGLVDVITWQPHPATPSILILLPLLHHLTLPAFSRIPFVLGPLGKYFGVGLICKDMQRTSGFTSKTFFIMSNFAFFDSFLSRPLSG